jgi:hypothetical protein
VHDKEERFKGKNGRGFYGKDRFCILDKEFLGRE